jgi:hypothetical protein
MHHYEHTTTGSCLGTQMVCTKDAPKVCVGRSQKRLGNSRRIVSLLLVASSVSIE